MTVTADRREPRFEYLCDDDPLPRRRTGTARYGWRVVAANNRSLGRAYAVAGSLEACMAAAQLLRSRIADLDVPVSLDTDLGSWVWRAAVHHVPVAVSAHAYLRRVECVRSLGQFRDAMARAEPGDGVVRHFGPRSLAAFTTTVPTVVTTAADGVPAL